MNKLKNKKIGRPEYKPNIKQLKKLYDEIRKGNITNEQAWNKAKCHKTLWYKLKRRYNNLEVSNND